MFGVASGFRTQEPSQEEKPIFIVLGRDTRQSTYFYRQKYFNS